MSAAEAGAAAADAQQRALVAERRRAKTNSGTGGGGGGGGGDPAPPEYDDESVLSRLVEAVDDDGAVASCVRDVMVAGAQTTADAIAATLFHLAHDAEAQVDAVRRFREGARAREIARVALRKGSLLSELLPFRSSTQDTWVRRSRGERARARSRGSVFRTSGSSGEGEGGRRRAAAVPPLSAFRSETPD